MIKPGSGKNVVIFTAVIAFVLVAALIISGHQVVKTETLDLLDSSANRQIPVLLYSDKIDSGKNRKLVILAHGRGIKNSDYSYISINLAKQGYIVASVQYELPGDEEINISGNIYKALKPKWEKAVKSVLFVTRYLKNKYPNLDCQNLTLIGHSMGGDILMLFAQKYPELVRNVISLDNCHMPFLRTDKPRIFSLRANNTISDIDVLPTLEEQKHYNMQIVYLDDISHIEMCFGTEAQKKEINGYITEFLYHN
jgi:predicted dienelactone hydrolase